MKDLCSEPTLSHQIDLYDDFWYLFNRRFVDMKLIPFAVDATLLNHNLVI